MLCGRSHSSKGSAARTYKKMQAALMGDPPDGPFTGTAFMSLHTTLRCKSRPIAVVPLCGNIVRHESELYSICIECARPMHVSYETMNLRCHWCQKADSDKRAVAAAACVVCKAARCASMTMATDATTATLVRLVSVCNKCLGMVRHTRMGKVIDLDATGSAIEAKRLFLSLRLPGPQTSFAGTGAGRHQMSQVRPGGSNRTGRARGGGGRGV
jgi:hypothetical protein